jgi:hypothetical protein
MTNHYYRLLITAGSKPLITADFGPSAVKVVGDKKSYHRFVLPTDDDGGF